MNGTITLCRSVFDLAVIVDPDGRFGSCDTGFILLYNHTEPVQGKEVLPRFSHPLHQKFERGFCRFELKSVTLKLFELLDDAGNLAGVLVELDTARFGHLVDCGVSRYTGSHNRD